MFFLAFRGLKGLGVSTLTLAPGRQGSTQFRHAWRALNAKRRTRNPSETMRDYRAFKAYKVPLKRARSGAQKGPL